MESRPARLPQNPPVHVDKVTVHEGHVMIGQRPVNLLPGEELPERVALKIKAFLQKPGTTIHYLTWEGSKVPRGARIGDQEVTYASNGEVVGGTWGDELIGTYDRIERENPRIPTQQEMVVYVSAPEPSETK